MHFHLWCFLVFTAVTAATSNDGNPVLKCPKFGFLKMANLCLHLHDQLLLTWEQAKTYCEFKHAQLATFKNANEAKLINEFIKSRTKLSVWLGATDRVTEGDWKWIDGDDMVVNHVLGWYRGKNQWMEPSNTTSMNCLLHFTIKDSLMDAECGKASEKRFIPLCHIRLGKQNSVIKATHIKPKGCPHPFSQFEHMCLKLLDYKKMNWSKAVQQCEYIGGHLVMSKTENDSKVLVSFFKDHLVEDAWLGGSDEEKEGEWKWIDGRTIQPDRHFKWGSSELQAKVLLQQPDDADHDQNCLSYFHYDKGVLGDDFCSEELQVVCQADPHQPAVSGLRCPPQFDDIGRSCLHVNPHIFLTWEEAEDHCQKMSAHLAMFEDSQDADLMVKYLKKKTSYSVWLGASDQHSEGTWRRLNGQELVTNERVGWFKGEFWVEPSNGTPLSDCLLLYNNLEMLGDAGCNELSPARFPPFCQIRKDDPKGFLKVKDTWLHLDKTRNLTWQESKEYCQKLAVDSTLASFKDANGASLILNFIKGQNANSFSAWLGGIDQKNDGNWRWTDETKLEGNSILDWNESEDAGVANQSTRGDRCLVVSSSPTMDVLDKDGCDQRLPPLCQISPKVKCGVSPDLTSVAQASTKTRVVGGNKTMAGAWPWMAALMKIKGGIPFCGGSLIAPQYILTAAHCFDDLKTFSDLIVRLGEYDVTVKDERTQDFKILKVHIPEQYIRAHQGHDIAILKLESPALPHPTFTTICLPEPQARYYGSRGIVIGWGVTNINKKNSEVLRQVFVDIFKDSKCRKGYKSHFPDDTFCAGRPGGGKDACQGDSGGPFMLVKPGTERWFQAGIVSLGIGCGLEHYPGIYVRVSDYLDWICSITHKCECPSPYIKKGELCLYLNYNSKMNWQQAEDHCRKFKGAHLAISKSEEQSRYIVEYLQSSGSINAWLGGKYEEKDGTWKWTDGSEIQLDNIFKWGTSNSIAGWEDEKDTGKCMNFSDDLKDGLLRKSECAIAKYPLCQFEWSSSSIDNIVK